MNTVPPTSRPQLVYLVFGAETYHQEAVFSIASALAFLQETPDAAVDIQVFSDNPEPYRLLPVRVRPLDEATRKRWSEPHGYHFRTKHVVLRQVLKESPVALLIDTDTFFHHSPMTLFERVQPGTLLCNDFYSKYGDNHENILYTALHQRLLDMGVADDDMMNLNSGGIGLPHRQRARVPGPDPPLLEPQAAVPRQGQSVDHQARGRPHQRAGPGRHATGLLPLATTTAPAAPDVQADHPALAQAPAAVHPRNSLRLLRARKRVRPGVRPGVVGQGATESGTAPKASVRRPPTGTLVHQPGGQADSRRAAHRNLRTLDDFAGRLGTPSKACASASL